MNIMDVPKVYRRNHDIADRTFVQLSIAARMFAQFCGGAIDTNELSSDLVNDWLVARKAAGLTPTTVKSNRTSLRMLWREANDIGEAPPVGKVRCIKVPHRIPTAFRTDELHKLLDAADAMTGKLRYWRLPKRDYWRAFVLAAYDSGLRLSDLLAIHWRGIEWNGSGPGTMPMVQQKTRHMHVVHFREETMVAIKKCFSSGEPREVVFPPQARSRWYRHFRAFCKLAGVKGTSRYLRRSGASYVAAEHGESGASRFLGHRTPELAQRSYIDPRIAVPKSYMPPALMEGGAK